MSIYAIRNYHRELEKIITYGGSKKETAIRNAFYNLLNQYASTVNLVLVPELTIKNRNGKNVTPDGTMKDALRLDHGYWESKDEADNIDEEIRKKFDKGYPNDNILFEDSQTAVLIQDGHEVMRVPMQDEDKLDKILDRFIAYQRKEISDFRKAIDLFKQDIPKVTDTLRQLIAEQDAGSNEAYHREFKLFHESCQSSINPDISTEDIREMMIQHILSADIFNTIFDEPHFHQDNNIARQLNQVVETFFTGATRRNTLSGIQHYYQTINAAAAGIADHHEKQKFLKVVYENFYKAYNPKAADRLGIVYTPNEIVQFMIKSTDWLLHKHFGKTLADKNVDILDPATGTGTFICDIIDYLPKNKLQHKYLHEIHANELAILPYYIANLNIEYTYKQKTGEYAEYENLCLVDTLDNTGFNWIGKQGDLFGVSAENAARIKKQNQRKISVIIGNPPYNANQQNENDNNKNRNYTEIDKRIKDTFIKQSTAQKTKLYDMYSRFYRWAMDRLNDNGVIAFITNRSFIDSRTFDGFRKIVQTEFDYAYILDTKSDVRANPKIAGTTHNVFGIQAGVAILFLVKTSAGKLKPHDCRIEYAALEDEMRKEEKLQWIAEHPIEKIEFAHVVPDKNNNWLGQTDNDWEELIPFIDKKETNCICVEFSNGINTARDEWVYDFDELQLKDKVKLFAERFNLSCGETDAQKLDQSIKWSRDLKLKAKRRMQIDFSDITFSQVNYRPFVKVHAAIHPILQDVISGNKDYFSAENKSICFNVNGLDLRFLASETFSDWHFTGDTKVVPLFHFPQNKRLDNITDWALDLFTTHYQSDIVHRTSAIQKEDIFHYVYAVLHHPAYRSKYALNLKREFPRIPLYNNFFQWAAWGQQLMELHLHYETVAPWGLIRKEMEAKAEPKAKLKADKDRGIILLDDNTELHGIPPSAWAYKLGNRSALEWILDQYKEKKPSDPTIAEHFNTYKFADYKTQVIDLLDRVCRVSVETMKVVGEMPEE
ncbi:MAG: N-6 DNA methylase [Bacteroidetes bacterium]|uniref:type ISP restriction/modification enzyme n=1 Tax=Phnomibacter sp. TaxID=2836217 RepID=UPI002FDE7103|nr:N-6 DNA methylase [Bacteroidota bacterium]